MEAVAAAAGVSRALVSLVVRNQPKVSEERRAQVLEAARQLGYRPNAIARDLASRRTHTVGVPLNDFHNPFFAEIVDGIESADSTRGYPVLSNTGYRRPRGEQSALEGWLELLERLQESDVRVPEDISLVGCDNTSQAALPYVSLTTIDQPRFEKGRLAIEMLLARIADSGRRRERRLLSPSLIIRRTTAPLRAARPVLHEVCA
jgi:DNA-binding LacI/PurR family transcriptional regulator